MESKEQDLTDFKTNLATSLSSLFEIQNLKILIEEVSLTGDPIDLNATGSFLWKTKNQTEDDLIYSQIRTLK